MIEAILADEGKIRLVAFVGVLSLMALWEVLAPRRRQTHGRLSRWPSNLGLIALDTALVRLLFPITAVGVALACEARGIGLLNWVELPGWVEIALAVAVLDCAIWAQHVMFHRVPVLWRLHRMHHADLEIDVTTGIKFHPVEIILSMLIKFAVVAALGAPALAVMLFEILLNATAMFNHSNAKIPQAIDTALRLVVVTPDMHRVHHSVVARETHSNFGFNLPWWDRLFGTYRAQPEAGHDGMTIGLPQFRDPAELRLDRLLTQPWRDDAEAKSDVSTKA